jgi:transposase
VNHLKTIPGVATKLASRSMGENGDINRFPSEKQLAIYCGVACVDNNYCHYYSLDWWMPYKAFR